MIHFESLVVVQGKDAYVAGQEVNKICQLGFFLHGFVLRRQRHSCGVHSKRLLHRLGGSTVHQRIQQRDDAGRRQNPDGKGDEYRRSASYKRRKKREVYV